MGNSAAFHFWLLDLYLLEPSKMYLTPEQVSFYEREGYLVIPNFWDDKTIQECKASIASIVKNSISGPLIEKPICTTKEERSLANAKYFESGHAIRHFWEAKSWENGKLIRPPELAIDKIAYALHDLDPVFEKVTYEPRVGQICRDLGLCMPLPVQSMYIFKQAFVGSEIRPHQDGSYLYTEPQSVIGFWWALVN